MHEKMLTINDSTSLRQLLERRSGELIKLELAMLTPSEMDYWQRKLNLLYSDCGCSASAGFALLSVSLYLVALFFGLAGIPTSMWTKTIIGIIVFFASAGMGKAFALRHARHELVQAVREVTLILTSRSQKSYEPRMTHELS